MIIVTKSTLFLLEGESQIILTFSIFLKEIRGQDNRVQRSKFMVSNDGSRVMSSKV